VANSSRAILVWGGDGTVNEVANAVAGADVAVLPCPAGTENLLAKELHIPSDVPGIVRVLTAGQVVHCDIGRVNDRNFLLIIGVGFDGEVIRRLSAVRTDTSRTSHTSGRCGELSGSMTSRACGSLPTGRKYSTIRAWRSWATSPDIPSGCGYAATPDLTTACWTWLCSHAASRAR